MKDSRSLVGVLGGMGPAATVDFLAKVIRVTPAQSDQDHIPLVVHSVPQIPDRSAAILSRSDAPYSPMLQGLKRLRRAGVTFAVIPCNTAHFWHGRLQSESGVEVPHIVDAVLTDIRAQFPIATTFGLMATRGTLAADVYGTIQAKGAGSVIHPSERVQRLVDTSIAAVKAGRRLEAREFASAAGRALLAEGAQILLLACTELPIALEKDPLLDVSVDSTLALARLCMARAMSEG